MAKSKLIRGVNDIATLNPEVARQWHPTKNGDLKPFEVYKGSCKKVWWKCPEEHDHEWEAPPANRTRAINPSGCPFCAHFRASEGYNLKTEFPEISAEWHKTKNKGVKPEEVVPGTYKKYWWICKQNPKHEYFADPAHRTRKPNPTSCPICSGRELHPDNQLSIQYPEISKQWHTTKNGNLKPSQVTTGSGKKVWWKCSEGEDHEWKVAINNRTGRNDGCPFCSGRRASNNDNLVIKNPALAAQWHPTKNGGLTPNQFKEKSNIKVWWLCPESEDHVWKTGINNRAYGSGCPFCSGRQASKDYNLEKDFPDISKEWHATKNGDLKPHQFTPGSGVNVWWQCQLHELHEWNASINSRVRGTNCPDCHPQSSVPEYRIYSEVRSIFKDAINRDRSMKFECDIFIPSENIGIEHDGSYYHRDKTEKDLEKNQKSRENGISLIRIRNSPLGKLSELDVIYSGQMIEKKHMNELMTALDKLSGGKYKTSINAYIDRKIFVGEEEFNRLISFLPAPPLEQSLAQGFPDLSKEWHPSKNGSLLPQHVRPQSNRMVWWKCSVADDHEWEAVISNRSTLNRGCPFCSNRKPDSTYNLKEKFPEIAKQWHPTKNGDSKPEGFTPRSRQKVWWKCPKGEDHEWEALIQSRTDSRSNKDGCPFCAGKRPCKNYNLKYNYPDIAAEWHPIKNGALKPEHVLPGSDKKPWWQCAKNPKHEWTARIANRAKLGRGCPYCNKPGKKNLTAK